MKIISAPAGLDGAPLDELKQWLATSTSTDDALLVDLLKAAHALCERFTGLVAIECEVRETFPTTQLAHRLTATPIRSFGDATAIDHDGSRRLLDETMAQLKRAGADGALLELHSPIDEPQVEARYFAGQSDQWSEVADGLRHGIIRQAAHMYRERDAGPSNDMPAAVAALWRPYRRMRL